MKTSCSFIAYKHRHRTVLFFIFKFRHVASFWKFGEGGGGNLVQKTLTSKKKKGKKRIPNSWKVAEEGLHYNWILYVQNSDKCFHQEKGKWRDRTPPLLPLPRCHVPEVYNIQKNNVKLENRYPNTVGPKVFQLNYMYVTVDDECSKKKLSFRGGVQTR